MTDIAQLRETIAVVVAFTRNVQMLRAFDELYQRRDQNFWIIINGNFLDVAVLEWCKLFGSDNQDHQPAHWKNVVPTADHTAFRSELLLKLGTTGDDWRRYRDGLVNYRNRQAAHLDWRPPRPPNFPHFEMGLNAAYHYYDWLLSLGEPVGLSDLHPRDLRGYAVRYLEQTKRMATVALQATDQTPDEVR